MTCDQCPFVLPCWQHLLRLSYCPCGTLIIDLAAGPQEFRQATVRCGPLREALEKQDNRRGVRGQHIDTPLELEGQPAQVVDPFATRQRCSRCYPERFVGRDIEHYLDSAPAEAVSHEEYLSLWRRRINHDDVL